MFGIILDFDILMYFNGKHSVKPAKCPRQHNQPVSLPAEVSLTHLWWTHGQNTDLSQSPWPTSKQISTAQALESSTPYNKSLRRYCEITDAITSYLAKDMVPINTVPKDGFKNLILMLDKRYCIPSRMFFTQTIQKLYDTCRKKVEPELKDVENYATTTDTYGLAARLNHITDCLTVHYIREDCKWKRFNKRHTFPLSIYEKALLLYWQMC